MTQPTPDAVAQPAPLTCYRHPDRQTYIRCVRCDRPICPECMRAASVGFQCPEEGSAPRVRTMSSGGPGAMRRAVPVTFTLLVLNVAVFVGELASGAPLLGGGGGGAVLDRLQMVSITLAYPPDGRVIDGVAEGQYWRLLTSTFVHYGILHIALNMYALFLMGPALERRLGGGRYLGLYLLSGLGGSVLSYLFADPREVSGGASGAIFGLFAAYAVIAHRDRLPVGPIALTIGLNLVLTFSIPGISILGHLGGLGVGALLGAAIAYAPRGRVRPTVVTAFVVVALVLVVATAARTHQLQQRSGPDGAAGVVVTAVPSTGLSPAASAAPPRPGRD